VVKRTGTALLRAAFALALLVASRAAAAEPAPVLVVVNPAVPVSNVALGQLRAYVTGRERFWVPGLRVELIVRATPSPERASFVERLSGMSEIQFQQYWIGEVFRGRATSAPRAVPDRTTALALVAALPGALALVADGEVPASLRVLTVDGRAPSDPSYPLR
jgi:hypothetical protein